MIDRARMKSLYNQGRSTARSVRNRLMIMRGATIVRRTGLWFVDIPRTGSSSLRAELGRNFGPAYGKKNIAEEEYSTNSLLPSHLPATRMRDLVGSRNWVRMYTFSFVRNPFSRILSLYYYRSKAGQIPSCWGFSEFVLRMAEADAETPYFRYPFTRSNACDFILAEDGTVLVDDIFRFEDRTAALESIAERIGIGNIANIRLQAATPPGTDYRRAYDKKTRELVESFAYRDLEMFEYEF